METGKAEAIPADLERGSPAVRELAKHALGSIANTCGSPKTRKIHNMRCGVDCKNIRIGSRKVLDFGRNDFGFNASICRGRGNSALSVSRIPAK